jgi:hypothetical protein
MVLRAVSPLLAALVALGGCTIDTRLSSGGDSNGQQAHVCSIGMTHSSELDSNMAPGEPCIGCHLQSAPAAPTSLGGTVYATAHEPNGCLGQSSTEALRIVVQITDMNDTVTQELGVSSVGNFFTDMIPPSPYKAKLLNQATGAVVAMVLPQTSGDCNACHTENGTTIEPGAAPAPGRIVPP